MADKKIVQMVSAAVSNPDYMFFDRFLIQKMLPEVKFLPEVEISDEIRWKAYHKCMNRMGERRPAAVQTVQHWFGIHKYNRPSREMLFQLGFALKLSKEEMEIYLKEGLGENGFQMSDYSEVVYYYCFHNRFSWDEAQEMIKEFELHMPLEVEVCHNSFTNHLWKMFCGKMDLPPREFELWMEKYGSYLKCYSMTSLHYMKLLRSEILGEVRWDAKNRLEELMEETGYARWAEKKSRKMVKRDVLILRFLESSIAKKDISEDLKKNIHEMLKLSRLSEDANEKLLMEIYSSAWDEDILSKEKRKNVYEKLHFRMMDQKYISELFTVGVQRERYLQLLSLRIHLLELEEEKRCPDNLWRKAVELEYEGDNRVETLLEWVTRTISRQNQRCRRVQRSDLLILIFHLVQLRKLQQFSNDATKYNYRQAQEELKNMADPILTACDMEPFHHEKYLLDAVLWNCFCPEEIYSLSDVIEVLGEI
jgi:hypothetical protein